MKSKVGCFSFPSLADPIIYIKTLLAYLKISNYSTSVDLKTSYDHRMFLNLYLRYLSFVNNFPGCHVVPSWGRK